MTETSGATQPTLEAQESRKGKRRWRRGVLLVAAVLALAAIIHYRPGRGFLTYVGFEVHAPGVDLSAPSYLPLAEPRSDVAGVTNFAQVSEQLYRGAQPTRRGFIQLKEMGIRTVVNLRETSSDRPEMRGLGMHYVHIRFNPAHPEDDEIAAFLNVVGDPANQPVFVHCQAGADRTGTVVAIYRVVEQGWPVGEAVKELQLFGFHAVWNDLLEYLADLDPAHIERVMQAHSPPRVDVVP